MNIERTEHQKAPASDEDSLLNRMTVDAAVNALRNLHDMWIYFVRENERRWEALAAPPPGDTE